MLGGLSNKTKQLFFVLIKLSIVICAFYIIYQKLLNNENLNFRVFVTFLSKNDGFSTNIVLFLLFLTIFNWFFEILKWQNLTLFVKNLSFFEAFKQCLAAHTASLFTPNRIGEYGAKAIYFINQLRKRILLLNLLGNMTQMGSTLIFGIIGFSLFITKYDIDISYYKLFRFLILIALIISLLIFGIKQSKFKIKGFSIQRIKVFIVAMPTKIHLKNMGFSVIRYLIFSFQFYCLLRIFGVDLDYFNAMIIITSMYLLSSIIPTIYVFDVIIKGSVGLFLFDFVNVDELTILSVIMLMWLLNFVLPCVFGGFYVLNFDYYKTISPVPNTD